MSFSFGGIPRSSAQSKIWFENNLPSTGAAHNICDIIEIRGAIDIDLFDTSLETVTTEATVLRTRLLDSEAGLKQVVR